MMMQPRYRKDTCIGCRALRIDKTKTATCLLEHKILQEFLSPSEPCEKPISYIGLREALENKNL